MKFQTDPLNLVGGEPGRRCQTGCSSMWFEGNEKNTNGKDLETPYPYE